MLKGANGQPLDVKGKLQLQFRLEGREFSFIFFVIENLPYSMIIGLDFMSTHRIILDCQKRQIIFKDDQNDITPISFLKPEGNSSRKLESTEDNNSYLSATSIDSENAIDKILNQFPDIIDFSPGTAKIKPVQFFINDNISPIRQSPWRRSPAERETITNEITDMLRMGVIRPSNSPWASPVSLVKKKDGTNRFCIDFRKVNNIVVQDAFPLPRIPDLIDALHGAKVFSTLDLAKGYWQIPLDEKSKPITAFATHEGLYEFNVLPFGINTAAAIFQRTMSAILKDLPFARVYIDDIVIFSEDEGTHYRHILEVFSRLQQMGLRINKKKCHFFCKEILYLGTRINAEGIKPDSEKIQPILDFPTPTSKKKVQEFMGMVNFYRDYIPNLAQEAICLYDITKSENDFRWSEKAENAFSAIKQMLTSPPLLKLPDPRKPFILSTDASTFALGAVLAQDYGGKEFPVAYASRMLSQSERNYSVVEKELLAIVFAIKKFRSYVYGNTFTIYTDHNPLQYLMSLKDSYGRIAK
jgi:hypothetical protein